jgi:hypothetical protein
MEPPQQEQLLQTLQTFGSFLPRMVDQRITDLFQLKTHIFNKGVLKMALTAEQQAEIDMQEARDAGNRAHQLAMEQLRIKMDAVRLAKETLIENDRSKPADERGVSASDITTFAAALNTYVNQ